ncbi:MAG: hypothetical protein ACRYGF_02040 [Janthinobacterium lividum]
MNRAWLFLLLCGTSAAAQQPIGLRNGERVVLQGTLTMEPAGRLQFVTVKTGGSYVPVFKEASGKERSGETLHEISLSGYSDYNLLYAHRGQQVTVTGKMMTDEATPYFWHGTRLQVDSILTANGIDLRGTAQKSGVAVDVGLYHGGLTLPADLAAPWRYNMEGQPTRERYLSCSSNGGGDVVNCTCAQGFHPIETKSSVKDSATQNQALKDMQVAQFAVGDDARAVVLSITCSR